MRRTALLCVAVWLGGCATQQWVYEKRGMTPAELDRDMTVCRREARDPQTVTLPGSPGVDRARFNRCMERRGYTARPEKSG